MRTTKFRGYDLSAQTEDRHDIRDFVRQFCTGAGLMVRAQYSGSHQHESFQEEARNMAKQDGATASATFENNRFKVLPALRAIVRSVFEEYDLAVRNGLDIGSGFTGAMVHELIPQSHKEGWKEVEINPSSISENQRRHPAATIVEGSYYDLSAVVPEGSKSIVTGLSTLDNSHFLPEVIDSIGKVLKSDGMFLHVQDVRPGNGAAIRWAEKNNISAPRVVDIVPKDNGIFGIYAPNGEYHSASELLRRELGEVFAARKDMEVILNHWVTATALPKPKEPGHIYYQNAALSGPPIISASAVVTLARKR